MYNCPEKPSNKEKAETKPALQACSEVAWNPKSHQYLRKGTVSGKRAKMLVDTGCSQTMVSADLVPEVSHESVPVLCVDGDTVQYPTAAVEIRTGSWRKRVWVAVAPHLPVDVLLGTDIFCLEASEEVKPNLAVVTRSQSIRAPQTGAERVAKPTEVSGDTNEPRGEEIILQEQLEGKDVQPAPEETIDAGIVSTSLGAVQDLLQISAEEMRERQQKDQSLDHARQIANGEQEPDGRVSFHYVDGLLYRRWRPKGSEVGDVRTCDQLALPGKCRPIVMMLAHDTPLAGHLGVTKTKYRILQRYYWPGIFGDIAKYCRSCEVCQKNAARHPPKAQLVPIPIIEKPFQRIAMDIVGPLPKSSQGNRFILVICDYATRYLKAVAMPSVEATRVAPELIKLFAQVGIPEEILTDQGTNFMSALLQDLYSALQIKRLRSSPYYPQTDGLVEWFNSTLKGMLRKFVSSNQKDWDMYLPYVLFAYWEAPQESTGFSPFELLYGRKVRGPLDVLRENWRGERLGEPSLDIMINVRRNFEEMTGLVRASLEKVQGKQKVNYHQDAVERNLEAGEQVLVLLPNSKNGLKLEWMGPFSDSQCRCTQL